MKTRIILLFMVITVILVIGTAYSEEIRTATVDEILTEARQNSLKFNRDYMGKQLIIEGYVGNIGEHISDETFLPDGYKMRLQPRPGEGTWVGCIFSEENADILADLDFGAPIKIKGTFEGKGIVEDVVLVDCEVVE